MNYRRYALLTSLIALIPACNPIKLPPNEYVAIYYDQPVTLKQFEVCNSPGCKNHVSVTLPSDSWEQIRRVMKPVSENAEQEREKVKEAVALFEKLVTPWTKTQDDRARNGWGNGTPQLDCVAEAVNTTAYLMLLEKQGLLHWHSVAEPRHRGPLELVGPHNTAVLKEKLTGQEYAIDSWFHANGKKPEVVKIDDWIWGFDPDNN